MASSVQEGNGAKADIGAAGGHIGELMHIPLERIVPRRDQPRQSMDPSALDELVDSIRARGVLQPIRVRRVGETYQVIAGERRWTAAGRAGCQEIPAVVVDASDDDAFVEALVENIQREDLNLFDRAQALKRLRVTLGLQCWEDVGRVVGISRQHVHRLLNISKLPQPIQEDIRIGDLTEKHGRALLRLQRYPQKQETLWERIHSDSLSGDASVELAKQLRRSNAEANASNGRMTTVKLRAAIMRVIEGLGHAERADLVSLQDPLIGLHARLGELLDGG